MSIEAAFNKAILLKARDMLWERPDDLANSRTIKVAVSNYFRNLEGPEEITMEGQEFVIPKNQDGGSLEDMPLFPLKKGDRLFDDGEFGNNTIKSIQLMSGLGGKVIGYRVRTT